jgi:hypothetical protein
MFTGDILMRTSEEEWRMVEVAKCTTVMHSEVVWKWKACANFCENVFFRCASPKILVTFGMWTGAYNCPFEK